MVFVWTPDNSQIELFIQGVLTPYISIRHTDSFDRVTIDIKDGPVIQSENFRWSHKPSAVLDVDDYEVIVDGLMPDGLPCCLPSKPELSRTILELLECCVVQ